jgi:hypothetical protein
MKPLDHLSIDLTDELAPLLEAALSEHGCVVHKRMPSPAAPLSYWTGNPAHDTVTILAKSFLTKKSDTTFEAMKAGGFGVAAIYKIIGLGQVTTNDDWINPLTFIAERKLTQEECDVINDKLIVRGYFAASFPTEQETNEQLLAD